MYLRETQTECRRETGPVTGGPKGGLGPGYITYAFVCLVSQHY